MGSHKSELAIIPSLSDGQNGKFKQLDIELEPRVSGVIYPDGNGPGIFPLHPIVRSLAGLVSSKLQPSGSYGQHP